MQQGDRRGGFQRQAEVVVTGEETGAAVAAEVIEEAAVAAEIEEAAEVEEEDNSAN